MNGTRVGPDDWTDEPCQSVAEAAEALISAHSSAVR
jgi:hypothetical protein